IALVAPSQVRQAELEGFVNGVGGVAEAEELYGGVHAVAAGLLHEGDVVDVEPADEVGSEGFNNWLDGGFEAGAERGDGVFDEVEALGFGDGAVGIFGE